MSSQLASVEPVFLRKKDVPHVDRDGDPSVFDVCVAAERSAGKDTILAAQICRGLWRIYPKSPEARTSLLLKGLIIRNAKVSVHSMNPNIIRDDNGVAVPTTKVWVDELPLSVSDCEIEQALKKLGCDFRSDIKLEQARDKNHRLTKFFTGRRFVFISVPQTPLPKTVQVAENFKAKLFHWEQKEARLFCSRCLSAGHRISQCVNEIVCRVCSLTGHKSGDPQCPGEEYYAVTEEAGGVDGAGATWGPSPTDRPEADSDSDSAAGETAEVSMEGSLELPGSADRAENTEVTDSTGAPDARGRTVQKTLDSMLRTDRSASKRRASPGGVSRSPKKRIRNQAAGQKDREDEKGNVKGNEKEKKDPRKGENSKNEIAMQGQEDNLEPG